MTPGEGVPALRADRPGKRYGIFYICFGHEWR
jgi:hypothetical protein